jgi:hypothetical protein
MVMRTCPRHYVKLILPELFEMFLKLLYPDGEIFIAPKVVMQYTIVSGKRLCKETNITACQKCTGYHRQQMRINYELQERLVIGGVRCCCDRGV